MSNHSDINSDQSQQNPANTLSDSSPMPEENTPNNGRIAKNAVALYIRMFFTMLIGFYTSRVVLKTLGVDDFGTYGVVGSVVAMMGFLNASMSGATSRFLAFELGRGDKKRLSDTFSSALVVHLLIAAAVFILAETVGLWFVMNKLVIPAGRETAAMWVYQMSIVSAMIGITQVPYSATIISHERMDIYAYFSILEALCKLGIVYMVAVSGFDRLIFYAFLVLVVSICFRLFYRVYCIVHFPESNFHWIWDKNILAPLINFSGWDLYGNGCVTVRSQGVTFLINIFFGVAYNAANSIAVSVQGLFNHFVMNVTQAFRPVIIKQYSLGNIQQMGQLMVNSVKLCATLFSCLFAPLILYMPTLLKIWLGTPPVHALEFSRLTLYHSLFFLMTSITNIGIHATGKMKRISFITGTLLLLNFPIVYILYRCGLSVDCAYYVLVATSFIGVFVNIIILKKQAPSFNVWSYVKAIMMAYVLIFLSSIPSIAFWKWLDRSLLNFLLLVTITTVFVFVISYQFFLNEDARLILKQMVFKRLGIKKWQ